MIEEIFTKNNFIYTFKSFLALTLALIVSIGLDVDKPMWAMITVLFIQTRPETGFIIEKGVLRIISSCVGIIVGFIIINLFLPFPTLAIFFLCVFISITMFFSVSMSHPNFIYALAIANTTCTIIIFDSMAKPLLTNSESIFHIGYSRFTEIMIGCLCSFLVNYYIFPVKIKDRLKSNADESLNLTVNYIKNVFSIKNFSNNEKHNKEVESILNSLIVLDNELSASKYESYNSKIYNDFTIKIIELIQSAHFLRKYTIKNKLNTSFREKLNKIGHKLSRFDSAKDKSILISDNKLINEVIIRFNSVVENYNLIVNNEMPKARNGEYFKFKNYNNVALAFFTISKATFLIMLLAFIWMNTQGNSSLFSMLFLPCLLSQLMIPAPNGAKLIKENIIGIIIAIPIGIFFTLNLLAQVEGYFELLILVLLIALFFPIIIMPNPKFREYSLGFCISLISLVQPSNHMNFDIARSLTIGLSAIVGCSMLWLIFMIYPHSPYTITRKFAVKSIIKDRKSLRTGRISKNKYNATIIKKILCIYKNRKDDDSSERDIDFALNSLAKAI